MRLTCKLLWLCIWLAAPAPARAGALRPSRALVGHDHDHPVCDDEYRSTVCPVGIYCAPGDDAAAK